MEKNKKKKRPRIRIYTHPLGATIVLCGGLDDDAKNYEERAHARALQKVKNINQPIAASHRWRKIVKWSDEDQCYIGTCPGLFLGGCHGDNETEVHEHLCKIIDKVVQMKIRDGDLPPDFQSQKTKTSKPKAKP